MQQTGMRSSRPCRHSSSVSAKRVMVIGLPVGRDRARIAHASRLPLLGAGVWGAGAETPRIAWKVGALCVAVGSFLVAGSLAVGSLLCEVLAAIRAIRSALRSGLRAALLAAAHRSEGGKNHEDDRDGDDDHDDTGTHREHSDMRDAQLQSPSMSSRRNIPTRMTGRH